ncbi:MAG: sulfite dehydrogenase [Gemmatimonadetes bacterium]|nr:sulfite dehydrogenase [Gemmatimonadota bacterium]
MPPRDANPPDRALTRRDLLAGAAGVAGAAAIASLPALGAAQQASVPAAPPPVVPADPTKVVGTPTAAVGTRSPFVRPTRVPTGDIQGFSLTPHGDLTGTITPADLHFERHHAGVPLIDPARHTLTVHGKVARPMVFSMDDLRRFPQVTRTYFLECSGNGRAAFRDPKPDLTPQRVAGLLSNTEWTGVPLHALLEEVGMTGDATWMLAEGGDACMLTRSIPVAKAMDDALLVWAQNGEPLRPENGFPLRLLLPGWEGNSNVKWLRRLELGTAPWMTRWETSKYTDPLLGQKARQFSFDMDAKSMITSPCVPQAITKGWRPVSGLAWTGRGRITRVEVSVDGGSSWHDAALHEPVLSKAVTRFSWMWHWQGKSALLLSRATDETGYVQPTRTELTTARGPGTDYHFNQIVGWQVDPSGQLTYHGGR